MASTLPQRSHKPRRLTRKRGVYYFRRRLPERDDAEVAVSLMTTEYREAEYRASRLDAEFTRTVSRMSQPNDVSKALREYLREMIADDHRKWVNTPAGQPVYAYWAEPPEDDVQKADQEAIASDLQGARQDLRQRNLTAVWEGAEYLIKRYGLPESAISEVAYGILEARVRMIETRQERFLGKLPPSFEAKASVKEVPPQETLAPPETAETNSQKLSEFLPGFIDYSVNAKGWRGQTLAQNETTFAMFKECCGDKPMKAYTRQDTAKFYDLLRALPKLYAKAKRWRDLPLPEIVEQSKSDNIKRLTMKTVKRHFSALGGLFTYAKKRGQCENNPAHDFDFPTKGVGKSSERELWTSDMLQKLFASPVWRGCHPYFRSKEGSKIIRDEKFWLPLLGLYHGNRLEEFAQLRREDIREQEGIPYFDITDADGRQLKNQQSKRRVPIHPELLRMGFMSYVADLPKEPSAPVFPELRPGGNDKKLGFHFTKWWSTYRRAIKVYREGVDYHSFRHGVTTKLSSTSVPHHLVDELTGHAGHGISQKVYKHKEHTPIRVLFDAISKVEWPELNLSHLYVKP